MPFFAYLLLAVGVAILAVGGYAGYVVYPRFDLPAAAGVGLENLVRQAGGLVTILANADNTERRELYAAVGLLLTYQPDRRRVVVECHPDGERLGRIRVGGGI